MERRTRIFSITALSLFASLCATGTWYFWGSREYLVAVLCVATMLASMAAVLFLHDRFAKTFTANIHRQMNMRLSAEQNGLLRTASAPSTFKCLFCATKKCRYHTRYASLPREVVVKQNPTLGAKGPILYEFNPYDGTHIASLPKPPLYEREPSALVSATQPTYKHVTFKSELL